jgi:DNA-binding transcriptional MerR regulator
VRISELAERVGVPTSTLRYYERAGLLAAPDRTPCGYRDYDEDDAARLLFVTRARRMGLSVEQIGVLLPAWSSTDCAGAQERVEQLIDAKQAEIAARIKELRLFARQLDDVRIALEETPPPTACRADLSCCVPAAASGEPVTIELGKGPRPTGVLRT